MNRRCESVKDMMESIEAFGDGQWKIRARCFGSVCKVWLQTERGQELEKTCRAPQRDKRGEVIVTLIGQVVDEMIAREIESKSDYSDDMDEPELFMSKKTGQQVQCFVYTGDRAASKDPMGYCGCGSEIRAANRRRCLEHGCPSCTSLVAENADDRSVLRGLLCG